MKTIFLSLAVFVLSCTSNQKASEFEEQFKNVNLGSTYIEVVQILGEPDGYKGYGRATYLPSGDSFAIYQIYFENNKVYGLKILNSGQILFEKWNHHK